MHEKFFLKNKENQKRKEKKIKFYINREVNAALIVVFSIIVFSNIIGYLFVQSVC